MVRGLTSASIANRLWSIPANSRPSLIMAGDSSARISPRGNVIESCVKAFDGDHSLGSGRSDSSRIRFPTEKLTAALERTFVEGDGAKHGILRGEPDPLLSAGDGNDGDRIAIEGSRHY